jgi:hypothetical protein
MSFARCLPQLMRALETFPLSTLSRLPDRTSRTRLEDEAVRGAGTEVLWEALNLVHYAEGRGTPRMRCWG